MRIGYLYEKNEKELQQDIKKGSIVALGVDVGSLLDTINIYDYSITKFV